MHVRACRACGRAEAVVRVVTLTGTRHKPVDSEMKVWESDVFEDDGHRTHTRAHTHTRDSQCVYVSVCSNVDQCSHMRAACLFVCL